MRNDSQKIVDKAWNFAHVLRDDGLSYMANTEQFTFLLFLKMADDQTSPPYSHKPISLQKFSWQCLFDRDAMPGNLVSSASCDVADLRRKRLGFPQ